MLLAPSCSGLGPGDYSRSSVGEEAVIDSEAFGIASCKELTES